MISQQEADRWGFSEAGEMEPFLKLGSRKDDFTRHKHRPVWTFTTRAELVYISETSMPFILSDWFQIADKTFIIFLNVTQQPGMTLISLIQTHVQVLLQDAAQTRV